MKDFGPKRLSRILFVIYTTASMLKKIVVNNFYVFKMAANGVWLGIPFVSGNLGNCSVLRQCSSHGKAHTATLLA